MQVIKFEFLKLLKKSRGWLGPILVFILIMIAYPLTVEVSDVELNDRKSNWIKPDLKVSKGSLYKYAKMVSSASEGCVTDKF